MLPDVAGETTGCLLPAVQTLLTSAAVVIELEDNGNKTNNFATGLDVGQVGTCLGGSPANKISIGPLSLPSVEPTTSGPLVPKPPPSLASSSSSSSFSRSSSVVSFSLNSPTPASNHLTDEARGTATGAAHVATRSNHLSDQSQLQVTPPTPAYKCNNRSTRTEPTSRPSSPSPSKPPPPPKQQHQQSSTFNAKFRVHSRHRSTGKLDGSSFEPAAGICRGQKSPRHSSNQPLNLRPVADAACATTERQWPNVGSQKTTSIAACRFSDTTNTKLNNTPSSAAARATNSIKSVIICNYNNSKPSTTQSHKSTPAAKLSRFKSLEFKQDNNATMSQTLQSIHSLSMQLNHQAASLRGSSQLDDEMEPQMSMRAGSGKSMASNKFSRLLGKKASRVKELLLQNFGKADRTTDDLFQMYEENFYRQQSQALKLQKEFKSYVNALKGAQEAGKSLNTCIQQSTGDYQSARHDLVCENLSQLDHLDEDLMDKLRTQILVSVSEYLSQFNELRDKIAKRRRKLIDFDSSRRVYELMLSQVNKKRQQQAGGGAGSSGQGSTRSFRSALTLTGGGGQPEMDGLQSATSQLVDEARLLKLREQYNYCKIMYETINGELHEELPMVYEKKMKNLLMTLQTYFSLEAQFHSNAGKLFATASDVIDELPMTIHRGEAATRRHDDHHHHNHNDDDHHHHNLHHHHQHQRQHETHLSAVGHNDIVADDYTKTMASGSSGMGSSGGDSSLESSSSLNASGNGSPTGDEAAVVHEAEEQEDVDQVMQHSPGDEQVDEPEEVLDGEEEEVAAASSNGLPIEWAASTGSGQQQQVTEIYGDSELEPGKEIGRLEEHADGLASSATHGHQQQQAVAEQSVAEDEDESEMRREVGLAVSGLGSAGPLKSFKFEMEDETEPGAPKEPLATMKPVHHAAIVEAPCQKESAEKKCLYKVKTSYKYLAEDVDELCFEADEIIQVIEFDEAQEQEEGWLMGLREVNGQKGLFPANFTRPI